MRSVGQCCLETLTRERSEQAGVADLGGLVYGAAGPRREAGPQLAFLGKRGPVREKCKEKRFGGLRKISLSSFVKLL